jgi:hypothetical protein
VSRRALRRQALTWLRADLAAWTARLRGAGPQDVREALTSLESWRTDADLAGLREQAELAKLPAAERDACLKLWADVARLIEEAKAHGGDR